MEPTFISNPYVQSKAPSSRQIREMLDREEASYVAWRKTRTPVRLPYASTKLNSPCKTSFEMLPSNKKRSKPHWLRQLRVQQRKPAVELSGDGAGQKEEEQSNRVQATASDIDNDSNIAAAPGRMRRRKLALIPMGALARSASSLPRFPGASNPDEVLASSIPKGTKQLQFTEQADDQAKEADGDNLLGTMPRRTARKQLQQYLHDFHSRQVFSFAGDDSEKAQVNESGVESSDNEGEFSPDSDGDSDSASDDNDAQIYDSRDASATLEQPLPQRRQEDYVVEELSFLSGADYIAIFEADWKLSEVEKTVRDAVERNRIHVILRNGYRVLLWFFRYYAGNAAHVIASESRSGTIAALGDGLFEIPSRVRLLEDLNVQCVDPGKYGVTDTPLKREHLIDFLLNVARMTCTHSANPNRLRMVVSEGVEMSDAIKTLVYDHFAVFAQIQDVDHFRTLFLLKPTGPSPAPRKTRIQSVGGDGSGLPPRKLHDIIARHRVNLMHFFEEQVRSGALSRGGGPNDKGRVKRQQANGMRCAQFLSALRAIHLITSAGAATSTTTAANGATSASAPSAPAGVEEIRAVRIFLSCLPIKSSTESGFATSAMSLEPRELTFSQFVEALLRVALTWKELAICHGGFDVCPNQMASDLCQCRADSVHYAFDVFDEAAEEVFMRIHAYRLKRVQKRTCIKMKSVRSLHALVALATAAQRPNARLAPIAQVVVESRASNNNASSLGG